MIGAGVPGFSDGGLSLAIRSPACLNRAASTKFVATELNKRTSNNPSRAIIGRLNAHGFRDVTSCVRKFPVGAEHSFRSFGLVSHSLEVDIDFAWTARWT